MGWSLSLLPPPEPELLDAVFLSAGRALHLANAFENKCQYVLRIANLASAFDEDPALTLDEAIAAAPSDKMLGQTLHLLVDRFQTPVPEEAVGLLNKARAARNFIAHEGASLGSSYIWVARADTLIRHAVALRAAVQALSLGDCIVSRWVSEIEEPNVPAPRSWDDDYPPMVDTWVFGHFNGLLEG
ncbi:hypothetical protein ABZY31_30190 [Streptomyces sp. NPDC006529]|uniref:hypothetical protein n=1 Tax=Streptomyces sp. NPDC006529 TaxID=3157177 RepID=UPI0033B4DCAB